jgi:hypothetical protein
MTLYYGAMETEPHQSAPDDLRARLVAIERAVDDGTYRRGPWQALVRDIRNSMFFERAALAADVSRVSRKLHLRRQRRRVSMQMGILLEIAIVIAGGMLMTLGVAARFNALAFLGALLWMAAFEPLVKLIIGRLMGVDYDYMYLLGIEPRLKMRYGTYLARPRLFRVILHLSGTIGSPLAAYLSYWMLAHSMPSAAAGCYIGFWILVAINVLNFIAPMLGVRHIGPMPLAMSSAGSAAIEIREAIGLV